MTFLSRLLPLPVAIALIVLIQLLGTALIIWRIDFNNAPELYFPASAPSVQLENQIRKVYPFSGTPIRLVFKARR